MQDLYKLRRLFSISPAAAVNKINEMPGKKIKLFNQRRNIYKSKTYSQSRKFPFNVRHVLNLPDREFLEKQKELIDFLFAKFSAHTLNLLGSGAVRIAHDAEYAGFEGSRYDEKLTFSSPADFVNQRIIPRCREIALKASQLLSADYKLIDWQRDFRSGFRFDERKAIYDISYGNKPGVNVKVPWELGQMQHLPVFAYHYLLNGDFSAVREFCNEVTDFYISNPPYFGVQWKCTMDASIRTLNLLVGFSFMVQAGADFPDKFLLMFANMIYDHLNFIEDNPEWSSGMRGNHYYSTVCSMLAGSLFAGEDNYYRSMLFASASEFSYETLHQFNDDGSNFEGSLPYHFFTFEMLASTLIMLENQSQQALIRTFESCGSTMMQVKDFMPLLTSKLQDKIDAAITFSETFLKNGKTYNIGDFDSGKFLKLNPSANYIQAENFDNPCNFNYISDLIRQLKSAKGTPLFGERKTRLLTSIPTSTRRQNVFSDFGIFIHSEKNYSAVLRCGAIGQRGKGGHAHNDQLSLCVKIAGRDFLVDPETYTYTSNPEIRNEFRRTEAHNTLIIKGKEQNDFAENNADDLFWFKTDRARGKFLSATDKSVTAEHRGFGSACNRELIFSAEGIEGTDKIKSPEEKSVLFHLAPEVEVIENKSNSVILQLHGKTYAVSCGQGKFTVEDYFYSPAYGIKISAKLLILYSQAEDIRWSVSFLNNQ